jgi:hypothetical protein
LGKDFASGFGGAVKRNLSKENYSRNRRHGGKVEKMRNALFIRKLKEKFVRKMEAGEEAFGGRKPGAGRIDQVVHRTHRVCTEGN